MNQEPNAPRPAATKTRRETLGFAAAATAATAAFLASPRAMAHGDEHNKHKKKKKKKKKGKDPHAAEGKVVTLVGEVVDIVCYLQHPDSGRGPDHAGCAKQCLNKGLPAGLLTKNKLYLLIKPGHDSAVDELAPVVAKRMAVTGVVIESGGFSALVYTKLARAKG